MRDFFINSLEKIVGVLIVLMSVSVVIGGLVVMFTSPYNGGGFIPGLVVLVGGGFYILVMGGFLYLGLGIYDNTKRTADTLEIRSRKG
ncbi:hypothetical protein [Profundibacter sp.]